MAPSGGRARSRVLGLLRPGAGDGGVQWQECDGVKWQECGGEGIDRGCCGNGSTRACRRWQVRGALVTSRAIGGRPSPNPPPWWRLGETDVVNTEEAVTYSQS